MPQHTSARPRSDWSGFVRGRWPWLTAALLIILGIRLTVIGFCGDPLPYRDQWRAEGAELIAPYLQHRLGLADLIASHNGHRIFFTRLLALATLEVTGSWNALAEMIANALIPLVSCAILIAAVHRVIELRPFRAWTLTATVMWAAPFGWENMLWGFQSLFYFAIVFSIAGIALALRRAPLSPSWWLGVALAAAAVLALASGAVASLAIAAVTGAQLIADRDSRGWRSWAALAITVGLAMTMIALTPRGDAFAAAPREPVMAVIGAVMRTTGWPLDLGPIGPMIAHLPVLLLLFGLIRSGAGRDDPRWFLIGVDSWVLLTDVVIAMGRPQQPVVTRYEDIFLIGVIINLAVAAGWLAAARPPRRALRQTMLGWVMLMMAAVSFSGLRVNSYLLGEVKAERTALADNVRSFARTGDPAALAKAPAASVYPGPAYTEQVMRMPLVTGLMPLERAPGFAGPEAARGRLMLNGGARLSTEQLADFAQLAGPMAAAAGIALMVLALIAAAGANAEMPGADDGETQPELGL